MTKKLRDIFVSDLARIDLLGKNARFTFFVETFSEEGGVPARDEVAAIVVPIDVIPMACARTLLALGHSDAVAVRELTRRLH